MTVTIATMGPDLAIDWASFINKTTKCRNFNKASLVIESYMVILRAYKADSFDTYRPSIRQCVAEVVEHRSLNIEPLIRPSQGFFYVGWYRTF